MHGKQSITDKITLYRDMRDWCLQSYGPSVEVPHHRILHNHGLVHNPHWAFWTRDDYHQLHVFLAKEQELTMFQLKF